MVAGRGGAAASAATVTPVAPELERLRVTRSCSIPVSELEWRFTTSGGPGGQHANRSHTVAEVSFDVAASPSLGPRQRERLLARLGPVVRVRAGQERSQLRNRELALERLRSRLAEALSVQRTRLPSAPSPQAREARLRQKHRRGELKRSRSLPPEGD
jgi:ribosome-associated protein